MNITAGLGILNKSELKACFDFEIQCQPQIWFLEVHEEQVEVIVQNIEIEVLEDDGL